MNTIRHKITVVLLLSTLCMSLYAKSVEEKKAISAAKYLIEQQFNKNLTGDELTLVYAAKDNSLPESHVVYYIFNVGDNGGFIIVSGDDIARPILGYSTEGRYRHENRPINFEALMAEIADAIVKGIKNGFSGDVQIQEEWNAYLNKDASYFAKTRGESAVDPLIQTKWDQMAPYWNECPMYKGQRCLTGCVATAMAQIMKYHNHPKKGTGTTPAYTTETNEISIPAVDHNVNYNFNDMGDTAPSTQSAKDNVARLMYHCGVSVKMDYGTYTQGGSGAGTDKVPEAIKKYFGYDKSASHVWREKYTDTEWINLLKGELNAKRPVFYAGNHPTDGGHAFVCDGYDNQNYFHFNWGWSGQEDGYYAINPMPSNWFPLYHRVVINWYPVGGSTGDCDGVSNMTVSFNANCDAQISWTGPSKAALHIQPGTDNIEPSLPARGEIFSEGFEGSIAGWTILANSGKNWVLTPENDGVKPHTGNYCVGQHWDKNVARDAWLFSPAISLTAQTQYTITFWLLLPGYVDAGFNEYDYFELKTGTSNAPTSMTSTLYTNTNQHLPNWTKITATFTPTTTGGYHLGFHAFTPFNEGDYIWVDDIEVSTGGTPPPPPNHLYNIYRNNALIKENHPETSYTDTGLNANATYTWSVKVACADGGESAATSVTKGCHTGIEELQGNKLQVFPNPTTGELRIMNNEQLTMNNIEIYDIFGRNVFNFQLSTFNSIDVSHLSPGMYFLKIGNKTAKFVKQ